MEKKILMSTIHERPMRTKMEKKKSRQLFWRELHTTGVTEHWTYGKKVPVKISKAVINRHFVNKFNDILKLWSEDVGSQSERKWNYGRTFSVVQPTSCSGSVQTCQSRPGCGLAEKTRSPSRCPNPHLGWLDGRRKGEERGSRDDEELWKNIEQSKQIITNHSQCAV